MEKTITNKFIDSIWEFSHRFFPERIIEETKKCIVDYVGCTTVGSFLLDKKIYPFLLRHYRKDGRCSVIGKDNKADVYTAALLNSFFAHYIELDDGHRYGMLHMGAQTISAMIAVAQDRNLSKEAFLRGIIVGYEATIRLAKAMQPSHKLKGFHATGTCGTIGTAIGIASALDYKKDLWNTVVSCAATSAAGLLQVIDDGSELKPYNVAHAAMAAVNAAFFGVTGFPGPSDILGGERGLFKTMAESVREEILYKADEDAYEIDGIYRKPYAACRHCHSAIEAALLIGEEAKIDPDDIRSIEIRTYGLAVKGHDHKQIPNAGSAKMSMPYSVAAALCYGKVNYEQYYEDCLNDVRIYELMNRMTVSEDPELSKLVPGKRAAIVRVKTNDSIYSKRVDFPLGEPENPISTSQLEEKYFSLMAAAGKDRDYSSRLLKTIYNIDENLSDFLSKL